jgi:two-component system CheB/CheR fusion protein
MARMATKKSNKAAKGRSKGVELPVISLPELVETPMDFPIVAVGASAGGLEAFLALLPGIPADGGFAFVFVLHQEEHRDHLREVIARATNLRVVTVEDGMEVEINHVYLVPSTADATISNGVLSLAQGRKRALPIDFFFRSLADDQGERAMGVILSGAASDGSLGIKAIKAQGGITFAQDGSARFPQMPEAAIASGAVDFVMPPDAIARELLGLSRQTASTVGRARLPEADLKQVFRLLQQAHDVDFTHYKPSTVERRIRRRMAVHKASSLSEYVSLLREDPDETEQLYGEILIRVTGFFRDPEVFEVLRRDAAPELLRSRDNTSPVRIWVPGCATGEEVYSLAILMHEVSGELGVNCPVQIFGTDVSEVAVDRSRLGVYPETIAAEVSPERLRRFFTRTEGGYRISKAIRDCCVFARQNVTKDPPFSRLDLVSCRNVMIYLGAVLQRKVMSIFHYSLRPNGYLLLGSSETIGSFGDLFSVVDRKHKIYRKRAAASRLSVDFEPSAPRERAERVRMEEEIVSPVNVFREADRVMLSRYSPPGVLINENMEVLQFRGRTSLFLEPPSGAASFNVLKMAREGLLAELRAAIHASRKKDEPVRREGIRVKTNGSSTLVSLEVIPFATSTKERYQIILFEEALPDPATGKRRRSKVPEEESRGLARLKRELEATREYLQSIIEEQEAMNEELRSANEEIQSSNEELQSTNEELETAKEELQSSNEELTTLNEELENRNEELAEANNDLINLLGSVDLPILMLDSQLRIRRFNGGAQRVFNLIVGDVGRPLDDLKLALDVNDLRELIIGVIDELEVREREVQDRAGRNYMLRIRPYRTMENKIDGAVLVLIDIDHLKRSA